MFYYMMQNFTDPRALEPQRVKTIHIEWEIFLLRVRNEALSA